MAKVRQVTEETVEYSSLEKEDIGKWFYLVQGVYQLFDTKEEAEKSAEDVFRDGDELKEFPW
jgi:hypothetical protein